MDEGFKSDSFDVNVFYDGDGDADCSQDAGYRLKLLDEFAICKWFLAVLIN